MQEMLGAHECLINQGKVSGVQVKAAGFHRMDFRSPPVDILKSYHDYVILGGKACLQCWEPNLRP